MSDEVPGPEDDTFIQEPVTNILVWGALYGFLARSLSFVLSFFSITPVTGMLDLVIQAVNGVLAGLLIIGEFTVLAAASAVSIWVAGKARKETRENMLRVYQLGRVFFWANCVYLATIVVGAGYFVATDAVGGGFWLILLGAANLPLLFWARKLVARTRWVAGPRAQGAAEPA